MRIFTHLCGALSIASQALALGEKRVISFPTGDLQGSLNTDKQAVFASAPATPFLIAARSQAVPLLLDSSDDQAIHVAAQTFAHDVYRVTGRRPELYNDTLPNHVDDAVIIGSMSSSLISGLNDHERLAHLDGKWESYDVRVVAKPRKGLKKALVVAGSDRVSESKDIELIY